MKILFDLRMVQPFGTSKFHGGGKYGEIVFLNLIIKSTKVVGIYNGSKWLNPEIIKASKERGIKLIDADKNPIKDILASKDYVLYSPIGMNEHRILAKDFNVVVTIHGLRMYEMPGDKTEFKYLFPKKIKEWIWALGGIYMPRRIIYWARHKAVQNFITSNMKIITVSEHSKYSIMCAVPDIKEEDIKVFYSPSTVGNNLANNRQNKYGKYYFMVSGNRWIKNSYRAVKAFDELFTERAELDFKVVITGISKNVRYVKEIHNKERFVLLQYVDDMELQSLYANAYAFVYPTLNEGFGYPPVEAMSKGTPVITSAIASVPEVCGDAAIYFNPYSEREIKMRILQMENEHTHNKYSSLSKIRYEYIYKKQLEDISGIVNYLQSFTQ